MLPNILRANTWLLLGAAFFFCLLFASSPSRAEEHADGLIRVSLPVKGLDRTYYYYLPHGTQNASRLPVIVALHGGGGNARHIIRQSELNILAEREKIIILYPEGTGRQVLGTARETWNAGRCCGYAQDNNIDDVGFITSALDDLERRVDYDRSRVYATGMSNGALMAYRLACDAPERFAAIAAVSGHDAMLSCQPKVPISILHFAGTADQSVPYNGGKCGGRLNARGWDCRAVPTALDDWLKLNSCSNESETRTIGSATCVTHKECTGDSAVELCTVRDGGHTWPGSHFSSDRPRFARAMGKIAQDVPANSLMWEFFKQHHR